MGRNDGQRRSRPWDSRRGVSTPCGWRKGPAGSQTMINSWRRSARGIGCSPAPPSGGATRRRQGNWRSRVTRQRSGGRGWISDRGGMSSLPGVRRGRSMLGDSRRGSGGFYRDRASLGGHGENRSESGVDGRNKISAAGTGIDGGDGGRYTSDEAPRKSAEVVNPHKWPCARKSRKSEEGKGSPSETTLSGRGISPSKPTPGVRGERMRSTQARMSKIPP